MFANMEGMGRITMKQWMFRLIAVFMVVVLLAGCGTEDSTDQATQKEANNTTENQGSNTEQSEETVLITITKDHGEEYIHEKEVPIEEGDILMDVMEENFYIETEQNGTFITSIERVAAKEGEKKGWIYTVNGEMAKVGAAEYELKPDDKVVFDFQAWE